METAAAATLTVRDVLPWEFGQVLQAAAVSAWDQLSARDRLEATPAQVAAQAVQLHAMALAQPGGRLLVAAGPDGRAVGYMLIGVFPGNLTGRPEGQFLDVFVHPAWRRRGVGGQLMAAGMEHCRRLGLTGVSLAVSRHNEASMSCCQKAGFRVERFILGRTM